jgi:flagellar basal body-associated protein FliL
LIGALFVVLLVVLLVVLFVVLFVALVGAPRPHESGQQSAFQESSTLIRRADPWR